MLKVQDLHVYYGGIHALKGLSINVDKGQIVTLIGANGAGKSSTLRAISGLIKNLKGSIVYNGREIAGKNPVDIVTAGIMMAPEGRKIFPHLSVLENLMLGAYSRSNKAEIEKDLNWVDEPSLGLAPLLVKSVFDTIVNINQLGKTVLLVEQNAFAALKIAHYAYVLEVGAIVLEGTGKDLIKDTRIRDAYLGG